MFFKYRINWYNEFKDDEEEDTGLVWGNTYSKAMNHLIEDYGPGNIIDVYLREIILDADNIHSITKEEITHALERE